MRVRLYCDSIFQVKVDPSPLDSDEGGVILEVEVFDLEYLLTDQSPGDVLDALKEQDIRGYIKDLDTPPGGEL